jgi:DNA invertase Pin-like site-specific DNA recombinase
MRKALRVGLYARVSTDDQQTIPQQIRAMKRHAKQRGWIVTHQVEDVGSGATTRPKREELINLARRREIDVILVWRLDRWGRSLRDLVTTLEELSELRVSFVSLTEALDLTTSTGRAMAGMIAVFAQFEVRVIQTPS